MHTKAYLAWLFLLLLAKPAEGQDPSPPEKPTSVAAALKKTVAFLKVKYVKGTGQWETRGTGFFAWVEDKRLGENRGFTYLVTNRHVAAPEKDGVKFPVVKVSIRMNLRQPAGGQESEEADIPVAGERRWYFPQDDAVDLAVMPLLPDVQKYDYEALPVSFFALKDVISAENVAEGDRVLFTGFFYQFAGLKRVQPIVREGILAMMPDEMMQTTLHKPGRLYLADVHVFGGNSGAPLFVDVGGIRGRAIKLSGFPFRLLGVVSGYIIEDTDFKVTVATTLEGTVEANSGVSTVVPADELKVLLEGPDLQKLRDAEVARQKPSK